MIKGKLTDTSSAGAAQWTTIKTYSTDEAYAWLIVDLYRKYADFDFHMEARGKDKVLAAFTQQGRIFKSFGQTLSHAICLAGLKVSAHLIEKDIDIDPITC